MLAGVAWLIVWYAAFMGGAVLVARGEGESASGVVWMAGAVLLLIAGITATYRLANRTPLRGMAFAAACFVPLAWIGVVAVPINLLARLKSGDVMTLAGFALLLTLCVAALVLGWWRPRRAKL